MCQSAGRAVRLKVPFALDFHRQRNQIPLLACCIVSLLVGGCAAESGSTAALTEEKSPAESLPKVSTTTPALKTITQKTVQPGRIEAFSVAPVHSKIGGYVEQVNVDIGDRVTGPVRDADGKITAPGQILAVLTAPEVEQEFNQKQAMVEQVSAEVLQSEAAVKVAESRAEATMAAVEEFAAGQQRANAQYDRWKSELDRMKVLAEAKTVTPKLAEETEMQFKSADASRAEADAKFKSANAAVNESAVAIEKAQADLQAVKAQLKVAESDRDRVAALQNYLVLRAPFDGIVTERHLDTGHLVQPARSAADTPLLVLMQAEKVRLFVDVPEADAALVENGRPAKITIAANSSLSFDGVIARTSWALQTGTRSLRCEVDVPNPDGRLRPGMYAQVELTVAEKSDVLSVPRAAIVVKDGQSFCVSVNADGTILRKLVQPGIRSATDVEIISGLDGSEDILTANAAAFSDGQKVERQSP